jgi:hypothetical protein
LTRHSHDGSIPPSNMCLEKPTAQTEENQSAQP